MGGDFKVLIWGCHTEKGGSFFMGGGDHSGFHILKKRSRLIQIDYILYLNLPYRELFTSLY